MLYDLVWPQYKVLVYGQLVFEFYQREVTVNHNHLINDISLHYQ